MDVEKLLRESARAVSAANFPEQEEVYRLELKVLSRINGKARRLFPVLRVALPVCLVAVLVMMVVHWEGTAEWQSGQAERSGVNIGKEMSSLYFFAPDSPLEKITIEQVIVAPPYVKVAVDIDCKENKKVAFEKQYLTDEKGRVYLFVSEEEVKKYDRYIYTFISQKKFESAPKKIVLHVNEAHVYHKPVLQKSFTEKFTLSLHEAYPQTISLQQLHFTVDKFTYVDDTLTFIVTSPELRAETFRISPNHPGISVHREIIDGNKLLYSIRLPKQDIYEFRLFPMLASNFDMIKLNAQIPYTITD